MVLLKLPSNVFIGSRKRLDFPMSHIARGGTLFVEPQEWTAYASKHGKNFNLVKLGKNNGGFSYLLNEMLRHAERKKWKEYFFCDDDITGFKSRTKKSLAKEIAEMKWLRAKGGYAQLMMSFAGHNWFFKEDVKEKIGAWCFVLNETKAMRSINGADEELVIFGDWDVSARLIEAGYKTAAYYGCMFNHKMKSQEGGAADIYKDQSNMIASAERLIERFGMEVVKVVMRKGQPEVRFSWKKLRRKS